MSLKKFLAIAILFISAATVTAQKVYTIENVSKAWLRSSGVIRENNDISGYFAFYVSDKIDKKTNEYTVRITDKNFAPVKDIVFTDDKNVQLLESAYNGNSIMFLFYNSSEKTLEYRAYGFDGKQKMVYSKDLDKRSKQLLEATYGQKGEDGSNEALFDVGDKGYVTVYPVKEGKYFSYEVNFFFTDRRKQWMYEGAEEQDDKWASAIYLGNTDSLIVMEVVKQKTLMSGKPHSWLLGLNLFTGKKVFEISTENVGDYKFYPMNLSTVSGGRNFMLMGTYYEKDDRIMKDKSLGLGIWSVDPKGKILTTKYNSWESDFSKYLKVGAKGKVESLGFIYFHKILQTDDGNYFAVGEGYNKVVNGAGAALNILTMAGGGGMAANTFRVKVTDMVMMQFDESFAVKNAVIYDKYSSTVGMPRGSEFLSPHTMALIVKAQGGFDYDFTQTSKDRTNFVVGYRDFERGDTYKGITFNAINYYDGKITTDKIKLNSKSSQVKVLPAPAGSIAIIEYFKKEKKVEMRMEKLN